MNGLNKQNTIIIISLILYSALVGIVAIKVLPEFGMSDAATYDGIAMNIVSVGKYIEVHEQITPPVYPVFLSIIYKNFGHNYNTVFFIQFILLGLISSIIYLLAIKYFDLKKWQGFIVALIISSWPYLIVFAKQLLTETLYITFLMLIIYNLFIFAASPTLKKGLLLGLLLALAAHTRPVIIFLPFWFLFFLLLFIAIKKVKKSPFDNLKKYFIYGSVSLLIFVGLSLPYSIYGTLKIGRFTPIASNATVVHKKANVNMIKEWQVYKTPGYEPGAEITFKKFIIVKLKNIYRFWFSGADGERARQLVEKYPVAKTIISLYNIGFYLILALAFVSLTQIHKNKSILILWLIIFYFWTLHVALFPYPRYTLPIMPLIIMLAGYEVAQLTYYYKNKN